MNYYTKLKEKFTPVGLSLSDPYSFRKYNTLLNYSLISFVAIAFFCIDSYMKDLYFILGIQITYLILDVFTFYFLVRRNNYKIAAQILTFAIFLNVYGVNLAGSFALTPQFMWFFLFPIIPTIVI